MFDYGYWIIWLVDLRLGDFLVYKGIWKFCVEWSVFVVLSYYKIVYILFCKYFFGIGQKYFFIVYGFVII